MYENISPNMVRGLSPEAILQYLKTDYSPLTEALKQEQVNRQFNATQRYNRRKDEESLAFDREKELRQAGNDAFTQRLASQQEQRTAEKYKLGQTPYDRNYLSGLFKTFSGGDAPQELINALTSVNREEAAGLLPGLSQYAINQRQQKTQDFKAEQAAKAQEFKAGQAEKAGERKAAFQAYAEEAAMSRVRARAGLNLSAQEDRQAFMKDRDQFQAQQKILLQENRLDASQAMQNVRMFTEAYYKERELAIKEALLNKDPNKQGQTIIINNNDAKERAGNVVDDARAKEEEKKKKQAPVKFGYSKSTGKWGNYAADEMPDVGTEQKQERERLMGDVEKIEKIIQTGDAEGIMKAIKAAQGMNYPPQIKETMIRRLSEGLKSATAPGWHAR